MKLTNVIYSYGLWIKIRFLTPLRTGVICYSPPQIHYNHRNFESMVKLLKLFAYLLIYRDLNVSDTQKVIMVMLLNKSGFF